MLEQEVAPKIWLRALASRIDDSIRRPGVLERVREMIRKWASELSEPCDLVPIPKRGLTLVEEYALMGAIHDACGPGVRLNPWHEATPDAESFSLELPSIEDIRFAILTSRIVPKKVLSDPEVAFTKEIPLEDEIAGPRQIGLGIGVVTPREIILESGIADHDRSYIEQAYLSVESDLNQNPGGQKRGKPGRKKADYETQESEANLVAEWVTARESDVTKAEFIAQLKSPMTARQFKRLLDRVAARKRNSEK